jgi:hypothetical protein
LHTIDETFNRIDRLIETIGEDFRPMLSRESNDTISNFDEDRAERKLNVVQSKFYSLVHYLGILKFVFFQRTVSYGLRDVVSGLPLSPERTMGNEAIYLAADNLAKRYFDSVNPDPDLNWDGTVSFFYPVQEDYFFGGLSWPDKHLKQAHIVLSEENKHFLGSLLVLAHEIAHTTHVNIDDQESFYPKWFDSAWRKVAGAQIYNFEKKVADLANECPDCYVSLWLSTFMQPDFNAQIFREDIADLVAFLIGGPTTTLVACDLALSRARKERYFPYRLSFLLGYSKQKNLPEFKQYEMELRSEIMKITTGWGKCLSINYPECTDCKNPEKCYQLMLNIGMFGGDTFARVEASILEDLRDDKQTHHVLNENAKSIVEGLVKEKFEISDNDERRIIDRLGKMELCTEEDPKHIIHCYYRAFRQGHPLDFATVLCSLAYNTYRSIL